MNPKYYYRKVTINRTGFLTLGAELLNELTAELSSAEQGAARGLAMSYLQRGMSHLLGLEDSEEPVTLDGDMFTAAAAAHLYLSHSTGKDAVKSDAEDDLSGVALVHLGMEVDLRFGNFPGYDEEENNDE